MKFNHEKIVAKQKQLENHPLLTLNHIQTIEDLRIFMEVHSYAVWDFMSLLKDLQHNIVPSGGIWTPNRGNRSELGRMINEIVLCEESDPVPGYGHMSHFDMYLMAMDEVGADTKIIRLYMGYVDNRQPHKVCSNPIAAKFLETTFDIIDRGPHCTAAAFAYGRETVLPELFKRLLRQLDINAIDAPMFHYYLHRHIEVDGDEHGPMSLQLIDHFINDDPVKIKEAEKAALDAIESRIQMFDSIEALL